jgi:hypothetical protein
MSRFVVFTVNPDISVSSDTQTPYASLVEKYLRVTIAISHINP